MSSHKIILSSERVDRLKEYLNWVKGKGNKFDTVLTDYWKHHSNLIDVKFDRNCISLSGEGGFYFEREMNLFNRCRYFAGRIPIKLSYCIFMACRKFFPFPIDFLSTFSDAYENIWREDPVTRRSFSSQNLEFKDLENEILNFKTIKGMKKKWLLSKTHILSDVIIKLYFYLQLMESKIPKLEGSTVCEIGSGSGNLASLFFYHFNTKLFLVDLPQTLLFAFCYLSKSVPNATILLPNEIETGNLNLNEHNIVMMTPEQTAIIPNKTVELAVNIDSMQEMNMKNIDSYFDMIDRIIKPNGYFFSSNRVEKIMTGEPIRFSAYPWRSYTRTIFYEINPLTRLVQLDPLFIRMEQYI